MKTYLLMALVALVAQLAAGCGGIERPVTVDGSGVDARVVAPDATSDSKPAHDTVPDRCEIDPVTTAQRGCKFWQGYSCVDGWCVCASDVCRAFP